MAELRYEKFIDYKGKRWFWARTGGGLFAEDLETNEVKCIFFPKNKNVMIEKNCTYGDVNICDDKLILTPRYATEIVLLDIEKMKTKIISLPENPRRTGEFFLETIITDEEIIFIPQSYHGILHLNKLTNVVELNSAWYEEMNKIYLEEFERSGFCFRALPIKRGNVVYLPFYNISKVLKYNLKNREYIFLDVKRVTSDIELLNDEDISGLIIQGLNFIETEDSNLIDYLSKEFLKEYHLIYAIDYDDIIYFFTNETIFYWDGQTKEMKIVEYMNEIKEAYKKRVYTKGEDRFADTLMVYKRNNLLHINFEKNSELHQIEINSCNNMKYNIKDIKKYSELQILMELIKK